MPGERRASFLLISGAAATKIAIRVAEFQTQAYLSYINITYKGEGGSSEELRVRSAVGHERRRAVVAGRGAAPPAAARVDVDEERCRYQYDADGADGVGRGPDQRARGPPDRRERDCQSDDCDAKHRKGDAAPPPSPRVLIDLERPRCNRLQ